MWARQILWFASQIFLAIPMGIIADRHILPSVFRFFPFLLFAQRIVIGQKHSLHTSNFSLESVYLSSIKRATSFSAVAGDGPGADDGRELLFEAE